METETTDPLSRFASLIQRLHVMEYRDVSQVSQMQHGQHVLGSALCFLMGRETTGSEYTRFEAIEDFSHMLHLAVQAEKYVNEYSPTKARERNVNYLEEVTEKLNNLAANSPAESFNSSNFPHLSVERLVSMAENLSTYARDPVVSREDIKVVIRLIDELSEYILASQIDNRLRDALIQTLGKLRMELQRVNIIGPQQVAEHVDRLLGQAVRAAITSGTEEQHQSGVGVFARALQVAEGVSKLIDVGQKIWPALERGVELWKQLP